MRCPRCKQDVVGRLTKDHIVPQVLIKILNKHGIQYKHSEENIEMVCEKCNHSRGHSAVEKEAVRLVDKLMSLDRDGKIYISATDKRILNGVKYGAPTL